MLSKPIRITNVVPQHTYDSLQDEYHHSGWNLGNKSYNDKGQRDGLTMASLPANRPIIFSIASYIKLKIQRYVKHDLHFIRAHVNGYLYGQTGGWHSDFIEPRTYTFVMFTHPTWHMQWGGEFVCYDEVVSQYKFFPAIPNTGVLIPASWDHYGAAPNEYANCMRTTIGFSFSDPSVKEYMRETHEQTQFYV